MSLVNADNLSKSYATQSVLDGLDLTINEGDKIALIGDNGAGKTTLLRLIAGEESPDNPEDKLAIAHGTVISYLPQQIDHLTVNSDFALEDPELERVEQKIAKLETALSESESETETKKLLKSYAKAQDSYEALDGFAFRSKLEAALNAFSLDEETIRRPLEKLSGGERMRVALARMLLREPDLMLLDEPTNHLDYKACEWLEAYLRQINSAVLFVSHDRKFINQVANKVAELNAGRLRIYNGNYHDFLRQKELEDKTLERQIDKLEKKLLRQKEITQTMFSHDKINQYRSSQKKEARISEDLNRAKKQLRKEHERMKFSFAETDNRDTADRRRKQVAIEAKNLKVHFASAEKPLFENLSFKLMRGQHVVLVGSNGCGKTTLLKSLMGEIEEVEGKIRTHAQLKFAYLGQDLDFDNMHRSVLDELLSRQRRLTEASARNELARFAFTGDDVYKRIGNLSGGERARLLLCSILLDKPDVLFMDEPTNHLDIYSRELLESSLKKFPGTILAVSHDRYFIDQIADEVWGMLAGNIQIFSDFSSFRRVEKEYEEKERQRQRREREEDKAIDSENYKKMPQWPPKALELFPQLKILRYFPETKAERRQAVAAVNELLREVETSLTSHHEKKEEMETEFTEVSSAQFYHDYSDLLKIIDIEESIYLHIIELAEKLKK